MALVFPTGATGGAVGAGHPVQELAEDGFAIAELMADGVLRVPPMRPGLQYLANGSHPGTIPLPWQVIPSMKGKFISQTANFWEFWPRLAF